MDSSVHVHARLPQAQPDDHHSRRLAAEAAQEEAAAALVLQTAWRGTLQRLELHKLW